MGILLILSVFSGAASWLWFSHPEPFAVRFARYCLVDFLEISVAFTCGAPVQNLRRHCVQTVHPPHREILLHCSSEYPELQCAGHSAPS